MTIFRRYLIVVERTREVGENPVIELIRYEAGKGCGTTMHLNIEEARTMIDEVAAALREYEDSAVRGEL